MRYLCHMGKIRININDLSSMIHSFVNEAIGDEERRQNGNKVLKKYYGIGSYGPNTNVSTLWEVRERPYSIQYIFLKKFENMPLHRLHDLYPQAIDLRGVVRGREESFIVEKRSKEEPNRNTLQYTLERGKEISFAHLYVFDIRVFNHHTVVYTKNLDDEINDYVVELQITREAELPHEGDIISASGKIYLVSDEKKSITVQDATIEPEKEAISVEDIGEIRDREMQLIDVVSSKIIGGRLVRTGGLTLKDERGVLFFIRDAYVDKFGNVIHKKINTPDMRNGDIYKVSGQLKRYNGVNRIMNARLSLVSRGEKPEKKIEKIALYKRAIKNGSTTTPELTEITKQTVNLLFEKFISTNWAVKYSINNQMLHVAKSTADLKKAFKNAINMHSNKGLLHVILVDPNTRNQWVFDFNIYLK